jgi:hypothetical protein
VNCCDIDPPFVSPAALVIGTGWPVLAGSGADCDCAQPNRKTSTAEMLRTLEWTTVFLRAEQHLITRPNDPDRRDIHSMPERGHGFKVSQEGLRANVLLTMCAVD